MKMTQSELLKLAAAAGVTDVQLVENETESEFSLDTALQSIDANREKIIRPKLEGELTESITKATAGKFGGTLERALIRLTGVDKKLFTDDMKDEDKLKAALDHVKSLSGKDKEDIQGELDKILEKHSKDLDAVKTEYEGKLSEANKKYIDRDVKEYIQGKLKDAPIPKDADRAIVSEDFKRHLQDKYHLSYKETEKALEFFKKDNPEMPALNEAGTTKIDILDEAKLFLSPRGLWKTDMRDEKPAELIQNGQQYINNDTQLKPDSKSVDSLVQGMNEAFSKVG